ncbi:MAG: DUF2975 domain-containing protein [Bacteroidales bacterium]|jgi:hypothetical protein|nr:DUF2975 domain-containing protein [Bacteroidales bacterium]
MKKGKDFIIRCLHVTVGMALVVQSLVAAILVVAPFYQEEVYLHRVEQAILSVITLLVFWQIRRFVIAFRSNSIFEMSVFRSLRYITILLITYVIVDFIFTVFVKGNIQFQSTDILIADIFLYYIKPIKFYLLFIAVLSMLFSYLIKNGLELKEESSLTI